MKRTIALTAALLFLTGCASTELNYNTIDLASTTNSLVTRQVLHNLAEFIDSDMAYPSQLVINSGTASTSDTLSASLTEPYTAAVTKVATLAATASTNPSTVMTGQTQSVRASQSLGLNGTDVRSQNWSYAPVTDSFKAWRLKALYRYVVDGDEAKLRRDYALINKAITHSRNQCLRDALKNDASVYAEAKNGSDVLFKSCVTSYGGGQTGPSMTYGSDSFSTMVPDSYYLRGPGCVLCRVPGERKLHVNSRLKGQWLHWRSLPGASGARSDTYVSGDQPIGSAGHYELFVDARQQDRLPDFAIFVLAAATQGDSGGSAGGTSAGASGGAAKGAAAAALVGCDPATLTNCQLIITP
jgi:hypothetical protein